MNMSECLQFLHMEVTIDNLNVARPILVMDWSALSRIKTMFCLCSVMYVQFNIMQLNDMSFALVYLI